MEDTHVAVMEKVAYEKTLKTIEERNLNDFIAFLKSSPLFKNWTNHTLGKLSYYFKKKKYEKGAIVYKTGDDSISVYLVNNGEFQTTCKVCFKKEINNNHQYIKHSRGDSGSEDSLSLYAKLYVKRKFMNPGITKEIIVNVLDK